jgi:hypothetical protein
MICMSRLFLNIILLITRVVNWSMISALGDEGTHELQMSKVISCWNIYFDYHIDYLAEKHCKTLFRYVFI